MTGRTQRHMTLTMHDIYVILMHWRAFCMPKVSDSSWLERRDRKWSQRTGFLTLIRQQIIQKKLFFILLYNTAWILLGDIPLIATTDSLCLSTNTSHRDLRETWLPLWVSGFITKPCYLILNETVSHLLDRIAHYNINLKHPEQIGDIKL